MFCLRVKVNRQLSPVNSNSAMPQMNRFRMKYSRPPSDSTIGSRNFGVEVVMPWIT